MKLLRNTVLGCLVVLISSTSLACDRDSLRSNDQPRTIFGHAKPVGGFVSVAARGFDLNNQYGYGLGGEVAVVMGRKFNFGFSGYGLLSDVVAPYVDLDGDEYFYEMGYGGLFIEPMIGSRWPVHLTFPVTIGAGGVAQAERRFYDQWTTNQASYDADYFFIAEPGVNVELNLFRFLRLAGGVSYRFTTDVYLLGGGTQQLSGFSGNVTLKMGWF